jgi:hypothetical protein
VSEIIETRTSEKRLPADSKPLGFNCIICGRDYGSIQFIPKQRTRKIKRKRPLGRPEPDMIQVPKRPELAPVDYSLRNKIIAGYEEQLLDKATKDLAALRRNGWQLLPFSQPLSKSERIELETYVSQLRSRVEARRLHDQQLQREDSLWNVTEDIADIKPSIYGLMKKLSIWVTPDAANSNEGNRGEGGGESIRNTGNYDKIIKWNPITMIRKYRDIVDPFRYLEFSMDFYAKVLAKYGCIPTKILSEEEIKILRKAFDIINKYTRQFYDRNYRYTWYEWFWIVRYAQAFTPGKAAKMLLALDGEHGEGDMGRISPKHIKDKINPVLKFWQDYFNYSPYFFNFLKFVHRLIEKDPQLDAEHNKRLEKDHEDNDITINKMLEEHSGALQQKLLKGNITNNTKNNDDYYLGTNNDDFKAAKTGPERVRIHHSNKNYQKEAEEFKNGLRKEKPKKKISCTFSPSLLTMDVRIKLHKEGKVPIMQI